jgi:large repetitive protein
MIRRLFVSASVAVAVFACTLTIPVSAQQKPVISGPIDSSSRVYLPGSRHPLAQPQFDAGPVDPTTKLDRMLLILQATPQQERELQTILESQQDKHSPNYHRWLTPEEFGQKFAPAAADIQALSSWLTQQGFTVGAVARSGRWIEFSGIAAQVERTFETQMRVYQINGIRHLANATDISVPASVTPLVSGVLSLHNFFKKPMLKQWVQLQPDGQGTYTQISPSFSTSTGLHALSPLDFSKIYNMPTTANGVLASIAIVARGNILPGDVAGFNAAFALASGVPPVQVTTNGPDPGFDPNSGDSVEATLDAEWAGAIGLGSNTQVVVSASTATTDGVDLSSAYIVDHNLAPIMSVSFGECETDLGTAENAFYSGLWQQAAAQGMSVFVSSGDSGAAGCDFTVQTTPAVGGLAVSGLASTLFNTAVGGTQFNEGANPATFWSSTNGPGLASALGYVPETVWSENCDPRVATCPGQFFQLVGGAGGASLLYAKPSWQNGGLLGMPADGRRDLPDVSLTAASHDPYLICFAGSCDGPSISFFGVSGTSASSPSFAGIMARIVNKMSFTQPQSAGRQGLANYQLYRIAGNQNLAACNSSVRTSPAAGTSCVFNDTTAGNNSVPGLTGFGAATGYDLATGLGSVDATNLLNAWLNLSFETTTTTLAPASITGVHGQPMSLNIQVTGATAPGPTGSVALFSSTAGAAGDAPLSPSAGSPTSTFASTFSNLPGGTYTLTAHYPGDATRAASDSAGVSVAITAESSNVAVTAFTADANGQPVPVTSIPYGGLLDLHATVAGASGHGTATGTVSFNDASNGNFPLGSALNLNQKAEAEELFFGTGFPITFTVGSVHGVTATYGGDASFLLATSAQNNITITKGNPTLAVTPFQPSIISGASVTVNGIVQNTGPQTPTGTVQFFDGTTPLTPPTTIAPGVSGVTAQVTPGLADGPHSITATYSGDSTYNSAVSPEAIVNVLAPFFFSANGTSTTIPAGQGAVYNLRLNQAANGFTGTISFSCSGSTAIAGCTFNPTSITLSDATPSAPLTVTVNTVATARNYPPPFRSAPFAFAGIVAGLLALSGGKKRRRAGVLVLALAFIGGISACGGGGSNVPPPTIPRTPTNATIAVTGTSGTQSTTINLTLTLTH